MVRHGSARQSSGTRPCGVCRRVLWESDPRGQYSKKIRFIEKHGVQDKGGRHVSKHSFDPPSAAVRSGRAMQSSGTGSYLDCSRVLWKAGPWGQYSGKISFIEKPGVQDERISTWLNIDRPQQRYATGETGKIQGRDHVAIVEGSSGYQDEGSPSISSGTPLESQARFMDRKVWGL